ncbi:MAG: hypothetical protein O7A08_14840 [SAR324 cluster bacterium]|nr:hypothetical protein [SAR324 cluster bacterium]MCZ6534226.1 hypothetical protein [SAR324 cluster bacterium]MCZ6644959.1 hypothetical protein [SAR324 cluster bacterium]
MSIDEAVQLIWEEGRQGRYMPESLRGKLNFDEGLRVQLGVLERQKESGERLAGWKIGLTSERVRKRYGTDQQPFGHIMAHRVFDSGGEVPWGEIMNCGIEPELCWTIGETLRGPGITRDQARAAVAGVCAGFEINEGRSAGSDDFPLAIADNMSQWGIVCGEGLTPVPGDFDFDALAVEMRLGDEVKASAVGRDVIDDHFRSLSVLANKLGEYGRPLEAGQRVITGSFAKFDVTQGQTWRAEFAGIGEVRMSFS